VLARQPDLVDPLGDGRELRLPVEAEKARSGVEDSVPVGREARKQLLGSLKAKAPVDDGKAEDVEPLRGRKRGGALGK
jgi:hypothetical protein